MRVALHRGTGTISRLIQWQTRSPYSHASVVLSDGHVIESREFKGVRILPCLPANEAVDVFAVFGLTAEAEYKVEKFLREQIGKPYDYTMVARFISRRQASRGESGKWFCAELVFAAFLQAGIRLLARIEPWAVSPSVLSLSPLLILTISELIANLRREEQEHEASDKRVKGRDSLPGWGPAIGFAHGTISMA